MTVQPKIGELLLGIEGLALLRHRLTGKAAEQHKCVDEIRSILQSIDDSKEFAEFLKEPEYDISEGYRLWSETYDQPLRLFPIEEPVMHRLLNTLPPSQKRLRSLFHLAGFPTPIGLHLQGYLA